jgi:type IV pilus assembly protein PilO
MANPMTKEEKQWVFVTVMFSLIILVAFYFLYLQKSTKDYQSLVKNRDEVKAEVDKYTQMLNDPQLKTRIEDMRTQIGQFEERLPSEKEIPSLLTFMKEAADAAGVQYVSIIAKPLSQAQYYTEVPFDVVLRGKYHNVGKVINQIENHKRLMRVDDIDLTGGDKANAFKHELKFKLTTFVFNQESTLTADTSTTGNMAK